MRVTRRALLRAAAVAGVGSVAGCQGGFEGAGGGFSRSPTPTAAPDGGSPTPDPSETALPTRAERRYVAYDIDSLPSKIMHGGVEKDGIPSIDNPKFGTPGSVDIDDGDPVFGLVRNGVARAYPQRILVHHEIVNDRIGGENVAVTYCPLTGTVQGFERGEVEFGVSGFLLNSNLVMYDRATDSRWPQILATAVSGPFEGSSLREFRLVWTTWKRWREAHPDTDVMTTETGFPRRYNYDPYGQYNPPKGYYREDRTMFPPLSEDDRASPKRVVIGSRSSSDAVAFDKAGLLDAGVLTAEQDGTEFVAVADRRLRTGYVYRNPDAATVERDGNQYVVDGQRYAPSALPLARQVAFDAMWFAWAGFYPETAYVR